MHAITRGLVSGFLATGPMTYGLFEIYKYLPEEEKSPLPPATITDDAGKSVDPNFNLGTEVHAAATMASHFGYGATVAVPYSLLLSELKVPTILKGSIYGLGVWGASYLGLLPSLNFRSTAPQMSPKRNAMMIAAHIVWGASVAYADLRLREDGDDMFTGAAKAPEAE